LGFLSAAPAGPATRTSAARTANNMEHTFILRFIPFLLSLLLTLTFLLNSPARGSADPQ
jgi:hypothetical protein